MSCTNACPHWSKPRTVCSQEGENDEDITGSDMTLLTTSKLKVKPFHVSFIFGRFYGLMLHLKVCTFSLSELLTWINGRFDCISKTWKVNEVDWGPSASVPNILHQTTTSLLVQGNKESKSNTFLSWIRTAGVVRTKNGAQVAYRLWLGRSSTSWKAYKVSFHMDLTSYPYLLGVVCSMRFCAWTYFCLGAASPYFSPMGYVSS